jgi:amino acid transporter
VSGKATLAQVYWEIEHPKLVNLKRTGLMIFVYSLVFTSLISFFAVMIIPDEVRAAFFDNVIAGLAMYVAGPLSFQILFHFFVVLVGSLILSGALNTSMIGSNGVLNRVSEDGVLPDWFLQIYSLSRLRHSLARPLLRSYSWFSRSLRGLHGNTMPRPAMLISFS